MGVEQCRRCNNQGKKIQVHPNLFGQHADEKKEKNINCGQDENLRGKVISPAVEHVSKKDDQAESKVDCNRLIKALRGIQDNMKHGKDDAKKAQFPDEQVSFSRTQQNPGGPNFIVNHVQNYQGPAAI